MKITDFIHILSKFFPFLGAFVSFNTFDQGKYSLGIRQFVKIGLIPLALLATIHHIVFRGSIMKNQTFFEFEAGGTNLGIAIAAIFALYKGLGNDSFGMIFLIYGIYLAMGMMAWMLYHPHKTTLKLLSFLSISCLLFYYAYVSFTKKDKKNL